MITLLLNEYSIITGIVFMFILWFIIFKKIVGFVKVINLILNKNLNFT